ncbi:MAG: hypothetical protein ACE5IR_17940 [bacterium]
MTCQYENKRNEIVDQYVRGELDQARQDEFDIHVYTCDACFAELRFRQSLVRVLRREHVKKRKSAHRVYKIVFPLAASIVIALSFWGGYKAALPSYYEQARLTENDLKEISVGYRRLAEQAEQENFAKASEALQKAHKKGLWGFKPYFERVQVELAIGYLTEAYSEERDCIKRNRIAYFLAKAYLMVQDKTTACAWLNKTEDHTRKPPGTDALIANLKCQSP